MGIMDNEGHDPLGFGNILSHTDGNDLRRLKAENARLRGLLREADTVFQIYEREATGRLRNAMANIPMRIREALTHEQDVNK